MKFISAIMDVSYSYPMLTQYLCQLKTFLLDLLFPLRCVSCGDEGMWICTRCLDQFPNAVQVCPICRGHESLTGEVCQECHRGLDLDGLYIATRDFSGSLRRLLHHFKYRSAQEIGIPLGEILRRKFLENWITNQDLYIIPVPLHVKRKAWRGFNQAEILSRELGDFLHAPVSTSVLMRTRLTKPQMELNRRERLQNLREAFKVISDVPSDKEILLIDDVATTGSTLNECAKVLKDAGAKRVWGLVLSRGT